MKDPIRYLNIWSCASLEEVEAYAFGIEHTQLATLEEVKECLNG